MGCVSSNTTNIKLSNLKCFVAKDYTEIDGKTSGEGVKLTKAWEATLTPTILQAKRQEFWENFHGHNRGSCLYLRQAAEADPPTAKLLLDMGGFILENGTMGVCISPNGHRYELPPFILSDPIKFKDPNMPLIVNKVLREEVITIKLRTVFTVREDEFQVNNTISIKDLKEIYVKKYVDIDVTDLRFFFGGKELQDNKFLIGYSIENGMVILVYKKS